MSWSELLAGLMVIAAFLSWHEAAKARKHAEKSAGAAVRSAEVAERSAEGAERSADVAEKAEKRAEDDARREHFIPTVTWHPEINRVIVKNNGRREIFLQSVKIEGSTTTSWQREVWGKDLEGFGAEYHIQLLPGMDKFMPRKGQRVVISWTIGERDKEIQTKTCQLGVKNEPTDPD